MNTPEEDLYQIGYATGHRDAVKSSYSTLRWWVSFLAGFTTAVVLISYFGYFS